MAVLSQDIKERIVRSVMDDGLSQAETAQRLSVVESTVSRTMRAYRERGTVAPLEYVHGPSPKLSDEQLEWLRARVAESPFLSTYEVTPLFNEAFPEVGAGFVEKKHGLIAHTVTSSMVTISDEQRSAEALA